MDYIINRDRLINSLTYLCNIHLDKYSIIRLLKCSHCKNNINSRTCFVLVDLDNKSDIFDKTYHNLIFGVNFVNPNLPRITDPTHIALALLL